MQNPRGPTPEGTGEAAEPTEEPQPEAATDDSFGSRRPPFLPPDVAAVPDVDLADMVRDEESPVDASQPLLPGTVPPASRPRVAAVPGQQPDSQAVTPLPAQDSVVIEVPAAAPAGAARAVSGVHAPLDEVMVAGGYENFVKTAPFTHFTTARDLKPAEAIAAESAADSEGAVRNHLQNDIKKIFTAMDFDHDGNISKAELFKFLDESTELDSLASSLELKGPAASGTKGTSADKTKAQVQPLPPPHSK